MMEISIVIFSQQKKGTQNPCTVNLLLLATLLLRTKKKQLSKNSKRHCQLPGLQLVIPLFVVTGRNERDFKLFYENKRRYKMQ